MSRPALIAAIALAFPASAGAATIQDDLAAAHRYWGNSVCAGQWQIVPDATLPERGHAGEATGIGYTHNPDHGVYTDDRGHRWDWHINRCEFSMDPAIRGWHRRCIIAHEIGHFIHGPGHTGPMDMSLWQKCYLVADALTATQTNRPTPGHRASANKRARRAHRLTPPQLSMLHDQRAESS